MKHFVILGAITIFSAGTAAACPWSGGTYSGKKMNFRTEFSVNADCTEIVFQSSGSAGFQQADTPETFALDSSDKGWVADIHGVKTILAENGKWVNFFGPGFIERLHVKK